ncbi:MAG: UDP-glucose 4-epimerase GalE [Blastocatellia bacterium]
MNVLVTGGAGYIGSVMVEQLLAHGHRVIVYDNFSQGHRDAVIPEATLVEADIADQRTLARTFEQYQVEAVIHMAANALVGESVVNPHKYFTNNLCGGISLLGAMVDTGVKKIVFSSTCATYGAAARVPMTEDLPQAPTNPYGESKLGFEKALKWYGEAYGIRYALLRYFNAAGATERNGEDHEPESHLIPLVLRVAAGKAESVKVFGEDYETPDGTCIRDYIHILDLTEAHVLALGMLDKQNCIYNLGYGSGYSVNEVVEMARQVTGSRIMTDSAPRRPGDPPILIASADKAMLDLGWQPRHSELDNIIATAWRWRMAHPDGYQK